jgi:anti-sigma factor ChrR (cupin superfamily)
MKALTCAATRRRLHAFHDRELAFTDQIAVSAHLEWCDRCASALADMRAVRSSLHALAPGRAPLSREEAAVFTATVVNRMKAEADASLFSRIRGMFDDRRLGYAGLGAAAATAVCVVIMLGMMRFATAERSDSLAAIATMLATPLDCATGNDLADASGCRSRWEERRQRANEWAEQDAVFTLDFVVTQQHGRLSSLRVLRQARHAAALDEVRVIEDLLEVVLRSRLDRSTLMEVPSASNSMIWLVEHATVRATKQPALDVQLPPKKRAASLVTHVRAVRV